MALYKGSVRIAGIGSFPDQIQYMSQDDYNNLSEETKMNGTTYGIIGTGESGGDENAPYIESLVRWMTNEPLSSGSGNASTATTVDIPEGANLILLFNYVSGRQDMLSNQVLYSLKSLKMSRDEGYVAIGNTGYNGSAGAFVANITDSSITINGGNQYKYYFF